MGEPGEVEERTIIEIYIRTNLFSIKRQFLHRYP